MATNALVFVLQTLGQLWIFTILLRFLALALGVPLRARAGNPIADFVIALTNWVVLPLRRILPSINRFDLASFIAAYVATFLLSLTLLALVGVFNADATSFWLGLLFYSAVELLKLTIYLFTGLLIVQAVLSWVNPHHPIGPFFNSLTRFLLKPVQRIIPLIGGIDLSPLLVIIFLQVLLIAPVAWLGATARLLLARS
jgi:YggT family protein